MGDGSLESLSGPLLIFSLIMVTFIALVNVEQAAAAPSSETTANGGFSHCEGDIDAVDLVLCPFQILSYVIGIVFSALTFNIPGAPWWIRVPMGALIIGGLLFGIIGAFS